MFLKTLFSKGRCFNIFGECSARLPLGMLVITYNNSFDDVTSEDDFDKIEVLSSQIENTDEFFLAPIASLSEKEVDLLDRKERERKRIARVVALISAFLFLVSVALVTISLYMAKDIDELGKLSFI